MMKQLLLKQFQWLRCDGWAQSSDLFNFHLTLLHDSVTILLWEHRSDCNSSNNVLVAAGLRGFQEQTHDSIVNLGSESLGFFLMLCSFVLA